MEEIHSLGKGLNISISKNQKLDTRSYTKTESVAADDIIMHAIRTIYYLDYQGNKVRKTIMYQHKNS